MKKVLVMLCCLFFLVGCTNNSKPDISNDKVISEVKFLSSTIGKLLNNLNNITLDNYELISDKVTLNKEDKSNRGESSQQTSSSQSEGEDSESNNKENITITDIQYKTMLSTDMDQIDWDKINTEIELLNTSWSIIMLDLSSNNIVNTDLVEFSNLLNQATIALEKKDKISSIDNLKNLYSYIPKFLDNISEEKQLKNIEETKYYIYESYENATKENWNDTATSLENAEKNFLNVVNDTDYCRNKEHKINRCYLLIKDLQNAVKNNNIKLYCLKYKNLIQSINTL